MCLTLTLLFVGAGTLFGSAAPGSSRENLLPQAAKVNGIEVSLMDYQFKDATLQVDLCFDIPSNADWVPYEVALQAADQTIPFAEVILLDYKTDDAGLPVRRCDRAFFVLPEDQRGNLTLVLPRLFINPSEVADCAAIQKNLDAYAIQITCQTPTEVGMGGFRWEIMEKPAGMSDANVQRIIYDASLAGIVTGPWQFEVVVP